MFNPELHKVSSNGMSVNSCLPHASLCQRDDRHMHAGVQWLTLPVAQIASQSGQTSGQLFLQQQLQLTLCHHGW